MVCFTLTLKAYHLENEDLVQYRTPMQLPKRSRILFNHDVPARGRIQYKAVRANHENAE